MEGVRLDRENAKSLLNYSYDDPNTWTREQLVNSVNYYRAKIKRVRMEYELILEELGFER